MHRLLLIATVSLAAAAAGAAPRSPGFVDLESLTALGEARTAVDLRLEGWLLGLARRVAGEDPDAALLSGIESLRVRVFETAGEGDGEARDEAQRLATRLLGDGWEALTTVRGREQMVSVLVLGEAERLLGLTVLAVETGGEAVFVNIAGELRAQDLARLVGAHVDIDAELSWDGAN